MIQLPRFYKAMSPGKRRGFAVVAIVAAVMFVFFVMPDPRGGQPIRRGNQKAVTHKVFTDDTRNLGLDQLNAIQRTLDSRLEKINHEVEALKKGKSTVQEPDEVSKVVESLEKQNEANDLKIRGLEERLTKVQAEASKAATNANAAVRALPPPGSGKPGELFAAGGAPSKAETGKSGGAPEYREIADEDDPDESDEKAQQAEARAKSRNAFFLPAGTMVSGVLLTGMEAASGKSAMREPFPALVRIKHEAILPNRFRADIRECFVIIGGSGDLASERAILRGETISCVRKDKRIVEASLPAYAVGEDGKVGVRGRVVSKQGAMIADAMLAGFLEATGKAFQVQPVPVLQTNPGNNVQYQSNTGVDSLKYAGVGGIGNAMDKVSNYYVQMAMENMPVIEVDAGRRINLILTKGVQVRFMDPDELQQRQQQEVAQSRSAGAQNSGGLLDGLSGSLSRNGIFGNNNGLAANNATPLGSNQQSGWFAR
jgi:conjugal transfer pilus assembly protein TraB